MTKTKVEAFHPFWSKRFSKSAGQWAAELAKPFVLNIHAQQPMLILISTTDLPTIPPVPHSSPPTYYQVPYPSDGWTSSSLRGGFLWNRHLATGWGIHVCYFAGQLHSTQLLGSRSRCTPTGGINLGYFHRFGTFLSLKSVLVEIGKWAQKVRGGERRGLPFCDCLSLFL